MEQKPLCPSLDVTRDPSEQESSSSDAGSWGARLDKDGRPKFDRKQRWWTVFGLFSIATALYANVYLYANLYALSADCDDCDDYESIQAALGTSS